MVAAAVDDLLRVGLVTRAGAGLALASPATTLAALVHVELSELEERRSRLDAVRASLSGFAADHMVGQSRAWSSMPFELLSMDESFAPSRTSNAVRRVRCCPATRPSTSRSTHRRTWTC
jgi:hypothetical protein